VVDVEVLAHTSTWCSSDHLSFVFGVSEGHEDGHVGVLDFGNVTGVFGLEEFDYEFVQFLLVGLVLGWLGFTKTFLNEIWGLVVVGHIDTIFKEGLCDEILQLLKAFPSHLYYLSDFLNFW
jgi:hypothetical protein